MIFFKNPPPHTRAHTSSPSSPPPPRHQQSVLTSLLLHRFELSASKKDHPASSFEHDPELDPELGDLGDLDRDREADRPRDTAAAPPSSLLDFLRLEFAFFNQDLVNLLANYLSVTNTLPSSDSHSSDDDGASGSSALGDWQEESTRTSEELKLVHRY